MYYIRPVFTDIERVLNEKFLSLNITQCDRFLLFLLDIDETWQKLVWIVTASKQVSSLLIVLLGVNDVMRTEKSSPPQKKKKKKWSPCLTSDVIDPGLFFTESFFAYAMWKVSTHWTLAAQFLNFWEKF